MRVTIRVRPSSWHEDHHVTLRSAPGRVLVTLGPLAAIAARRGVSAPTVAKQVASMFERLGVGSRAELFAALLQPRGVTGRRSSNRPDSVQPVGHLSLDTYGCGAGLNARPR